MSIRSHAILVVFLLLAAFQGAHAQQSEMIVSQPVSPTVSKPVSELPAYRPALGPVRDINPRQTHDFEEKRRKAKEHTFGPEQIGRPDALALLQQQTRPDEVNAFNTPILNFNGQGFTNVNPPDTVGDVGPNHYVQAINASGGTVVQIYNKSTGATIGAQFALDSLAATAPCNSGLGDPVVLYDQAADRWLLSEFSTQAARTLCIYISTTPNPAGTYYAYAFQAPSFPDYPKYGVWSNAYYASANESSPSVFAFDRSKMLAGLAATGIRFTAPKLSGFGFQALTPADVDGAVAPAANAPGIFMRHVDDEIHSPPGNPAGDSLEIWAFNPNFTTPASSTFSLQGTVNRAESARVDRRPDVAGRIASPDEINVFTDFNSTLCGQTSFSCMGTPGILQGAGNSLDPLREVIMNRLVYRNFGTHETLLGNFVVDVGADIGGVRWFELRRTGGGPWTLHQEGTYAPTPGVNRWMGGIAMDGSGNIALAYNVSSSSIYPSIRFTGRLAGDTLGVMTQAETALANGTANNGSNRYGDYAAMSVDPSDDCTFWFTSQFNTASAWSTRISSFKFDQCGTPGFSLGAASTSQTICAGSNAQYTINVGSVSGFAGPVTLNATGLPAGTTAVFSPNPVNPGGTATLTISNTAGVSAGNYTIAVSGTSPGAADRILDVTLSVSSGVPAAPTLVGPANNAGGQPLQQVFSWTNGAQTATSTVEIATDAAFTNIIHTSAPVTGTSYTGPALSANTTYYWRVRGNNTCGAGQNSSVSSFTTACVTVVSFSGAPVPIPDNSVAGVDIPITVSNTGTIADVNFRFDVPVGATCDTTIGDADCAVDHSYLGDLVFRLTSPGGTGVTFLNRITTGGGGNSGNNIGAALIDDDGGFPLIQNFGGAPIAGNFTGANPFSAFDGTNANGTWTLNVSDRVGTDSGSVRRFSLVISGGCPAPPPPAPVVSTPADASVTNDNTPTYSGTAQANATVTVFVDNSSVGTTPANGGGSWSLTPAGSLADGIHTVRATASNAGGSSPDSNTHTFRVDTQAPNTVINSNPPNPSASTDANFTFSGTDVGGSGVASLECRLDGASFGPCTSPLNFASLTPGSHTFQARATDNAGNVDATPASYTWVIDLPTTINPVATSRQQGSPVSNSTVANAGDGDTPANVLTVQVNGGAAATVNGVTVTLTDQNGGAAGTNPTASGEVKANVVAACTATNAAFTLSAADPGGSTDTTILNVEVTPNGLPVLTYNTPASVALGQNNITVAPVSAPSDNGSVASTVLESAGTFTGTIAVHPTNGTVTLGGAGPVGVHTITVRTTDNCGATSLSNFNLAVGQVATTTTASTSAVPSTYGQSVTLLATVASVGAAGGVPAGSVTWRDGGTDCVTGTELGTAALNGLGQASLPIASLGAGLHTVRACYGGGPIHFASSGTASHTVNKAVLTVAASAHGITYGDAAPSVTPTVTGFVLNEDASALTAPPTCSTTYAQGSAVTGSPYQATCSGAAAANYTFNYVNGAVTVGKAALTFTADDKSRVYGQSNPAFTATAGGFVLGQNLGTSGVTGSPAFSTAAATFIAPGQYAITAAQGTLASPNYSFAFAPGLLTVSQASTTAAITNAAALVTPTNAGQSYVVQFAASPVAPGSGTPTGTVTVSDGTGATCDFVLTAGSGGTGSCNLASATPGNKTITASYAGDTNFVSSTSAGVPHQVGLSIAGNVKQFITAGPNTNLANIAIDLEVDGAAAGTATTDASGNFEFVLTTGGSVVKLTPSRPGKLFDPMSRTFTNLTEAITTADFLTYDRDGPNFTPREIRVRNVGPATPGQPVSVPVDIASRGNETSVRFSLVFDPAMLSAPSSISCGSGFAGCSVAPFDIGTPGRVGITVTRATPPASGVRELIRVSFPTNPNAAGSSAITFADAPAVRSVANVAGDPVPALYVAGTVAFPPPTFSITGRVLTATGAGLRSEVVRLIPAGGGPVRTALTSSFGVYTFADVPPGEYTVTVRPGRNRFEPRPISLNGSLVDLDFVALE